MKMRMNTFRCLLVFVLGCCVTAEIIHEVVEEKDSVILPCPHSVGAKVTWSRETNGRKVDILTADSDGDIKHMNDPGKRYNSQADKSLHIRRVNPSDTGRYFCDNEAVVLTVIPSGGHKTPTTVPSTPPLANTGRETPPPPPTTTTTTTTATSTPPSPPPATAAAYLLQMSVRTVIGILCLIVMISITVVTWRKARQKQKRHTAETVYDL